MKCRFKRSDLKRNSIIIFIILCDVTYKLPAACKKKNCFTLHEHPSTTSERVRKSKELCEKVIYKINQSYTKHVLCLYLIKWFHFLYRMFNVLDFNTFFLIPSTICWNTHHQTEFYVHPNLQLMYDIVSIIKIVIPIIRFLGNCFMKRTLTKK